MLREYQVTIDFVMDDYDASQDGYSICDFLRRITASYTEKENTVTVRLVPGAEVQQ